MKEKWYKEGGVFPTVKCGDVLILKVINSRDILIKFVDTGYERTTHAQYIKSGTVDNPLARNICGVGFMGVGPHKSRIPSPNGGQGKKNPAYVTWKCMIERCYGENTTAYYLYGARGVYVCEEWHNFQNYADWFGINMLENSASLQVDKDILFSDNLVYSPETCVAVPNYINNTFKSVPESDKPLGVSKSSGTKNYQASIKYNNEGRFLGNFPTIEEAHKAWQMAKIECLADLCKRYKTEESYNDLVLASIHRLIEAINKDLKCNRHTRIFYQSN